MQSPWFSVAGYFKGLSEVRGSVTNPKIAEMFRISGHPEIKDDETPWCAAFVGACLRLSGYRSSGSLGARSYEHFGQDLNGVPQRGCIVVFTRGDPSAATGHVAFFDSENGDRIKVLGGNQGDAVTVASFPRSRVLSYRLPVETAPLPTDTTLPNILTIDPDNAPPHVRGIGAAPAVALGGFREARATEALAEGAGGPQVVALQQALAAAGFQPGEIDGEYGPQTASAVSSLQSLRGLAVTGIADAGTLRSLGLAVPQRPAPVGIAAEGGASMQQQDILKTLFEVLAAQNQPPATQAKPAPAGVDTSQLLQIVLGALTGKQGAVSAAGTTPPVMSPIDKVLGGEMLQGKKTPLAILAYALLSIVQAVEPGTASGSTNTILTTLIGGFGGLGVLAKVDRVVQLLGMIATRPK